MKTLTKQKGFIALLPLIFVILLIGSWIGNVVKLTNCDFANTPESTLKCEIVHVIGLVPIISLATVWVDSDKTNQ